jgi:hypothetical protein
MAGPAQVQADQLLDGRLGFDDENVCWHKKIPGKNVYFVATLYLINNYHFTMHQRDLL